MKTQAQLLAEILLDDTASPFDKDDAAMDLDFFDEDIALQTLLKITTGEIADPAIVDVCGESIAQIWLRKNQFDLKTYQRLLPVARREVYDAVWGNKPEWVETYNLKPNGRSTQDLQGERM
jgi:hypothetical protein